MSGYDAWKLQTPEEANAKFFIEEDMLHCGWCDEEITEDSYHDIHGEDVCSDCIDKTVRWAA